MLVYGAGAIGQYLGGRLAAAGVPVHFVARAPAVAALREGLRLTELDGTQIDVPASRYGASTDLHGVSAPGLVLLTVKSAATAPAAAALAEHLPAGTPVLSFQNGVDNVAAFAAAAPALPVAAGMVPFNVVLPQPGRVQRTTSGVLGAARTAATEVWAPTFARAGLPLELHDDIVAVQWGKLLLNLNNPINAIAGIPLREELLDRGYRRILSDVQKEALSTLHRAGIAPAKLTPLPAAWVARALRLPTWLFRRLASRLLTIHPAARSSMYDDRVAGRTPEVDALCGAVVRLAQQHGRSAPLNERLQQLVLTIPQGEFWSAAELARRLHGPAP